MLGDPLRRVWERELFCSMEGPRPPRRAEIGLCPLYTDVHSTHIYVYTTIYVHMRIYIYIHIQYSILVYIILATLWDMNIHVQSPQESCAAAEVGCPCDPVWEHQCTMFGYGHGDMGTMGPWVHARTFRRDTWGILVGLEWSMVYIGFLWLRSCLYSRGSPTIMVY